MSHTQIPRYYYLNTIFLWCSTIKAWIHQINEGDGLKLASILRFDLRWWTTSLVCLISKYWLGYYLCTEVFMSFANVQTLWIYLNNHYDYCQPTLHLWCACLLVWQDIYKDGEGIWNNECLYEVTACLASGPALLILANAGKGDFNGLSFALSQFNHVVWS